jgi:tryptophan synthase beta chain
LSRLPTTVIACVGGGSNAIGMFAAFIDDNDVEIVGVEAAGRGLDSGAHAAPLSRGTPGVLHGAHSYLMQDASGQVASTHSISAGLDYPGVGPEHSALRDSGRATYLSATDEDALAAFEILSRLEGIIPALEPAHALHVAMQLAEQRQETDVILVCLSGRGDKDIDTVRAHEGA